ncbi:hypothetical protein RD792_011795 [Penstemon davidsonii]|uniref:Yippee domain-containing protein n=1 Tax=Penstemon davidsonii TaxID=160366 RepID=A0ABR0CV48_9LAMI|nr:hypothetical protein RD792_011795 [Penstemon davidsonii]
MGRLFLIHLEGNTYTCKHCETQLAHARDVVSKVFFFSDFPIFRSTMTLSCASMGRLTSLIMLLKYICSCMFCQWQEVAHDKSQKYKEGKFILERFKVLGPDGSSYSYTQEVQMAGNDADD